MVNLNTEDFKKFYDFNEHKFKNESLIILDFFADWCTQCVIVEKILSDLEKKYQNITFYRVDCDIEFEIVKLFAIKNLPTIIFISEDEVYKQISGSMSLSKIDKILSDMITEKSVLVA